MTHYRFNVYRVGHVYSVCIYTCGVNARLATKKKNIFRQYPINNQFLFIDHNRSISSTFITVTLAPAIVTPFQSLPKKRKPNCG